MFLEEEGGRLGSRGGLETAKCNEVCVVFYS